MPKSERVQEIVLDCLFKDEEIVDGKPILEPIVVEGITSKIGFHPERLKSHKNEIKEMLSEFPDVFMKGQGGGYSFLFFCETKDGEQWTGLHRNMEALMCLGMGNNLIEYCLPREMWNSLPGGMPYFTIDLSKG